jgi:MoxR-like ATPase
MPATTAHDLKTLVLSFHPVVALESVEEERVLALVRSVAFELKLPVFEWSITQGLLRHPSGAAHPTSNLERRATNAAPVHGSTDPLGVLRHIETLTVEAIFHLRDLGVHLQRPDVQRAFLDVAAKFRRTRSTVVLSGVTTELPAAVLPSIVHLRLQLPSAVELRRLIGTVSSSLRASGQAITIDLGPEDVEALVRALSGLTLNQARQTLAYAALSDGRLAADDVERILGRKAQIIQDGGLLEYFPAGDNPFEIGGFGRFRAWLEQARVGFGDEARALNLRPPRGVLLVGVQGCGKSLAAKVVARSWRLPLLKLDAGRLMDKYVGESEKNFRRAIDMAESMAPAVLWIDEVEKAFPPGSSDADGGLGRRLLGAFLTWLQERKAPVFVAATANDLSTVPPELMRKGRFDEIFFVDLPDAAERAEILRIHLALRQQAPAGFDLPAIAGAAEGFSGAELEQAVVAALYRALYEKRPLDTPMLRSMIEATVPLSVSRHEDIAALRSYAAGRFVPVR